MDPAGPPPTQHASVSNFNDASPASDLTKPGLESPPVVAVDIADFEREAEPVPLSALVHTDSPRSAGVDPTHVQRLLEASCPLPPILVHRPTMQVIDGFHRVAAAKQLGDDEIEACLIDGPAELMFVVAVRANVTHGLPLSLADRRAAAERILRTYADWSDRAIASATGLSAKTVSGIRCANGEDQQLHKRMGKDGRLRPLDAAAGRRLAAELLLSRPSASLRQIAAAAGVSPGTVRDVRARLSRGDDPVPSGAEAGVSNSSDSCKPSRRRPPRGTGREPTDVTPVLLTLSKDPALRMSAAGRDLLRWLHIHAVNAADSTKMVQFVPDHCVEHLVELSSRCAANWTAIANELEHRAKGQLPSRTDAVARIVPNVERRTG